MTKEEAYRLAMRACEETWNEKTCKQIREVLEQEQTGHWIEQPRGYLETPKFECSECHRQQFVETCMGKPMWAYCPMCGARMVDE